MVVVSDVVRGKMCDVKSHVRSHMKSHIKCQAVKVNIIGKVEMMVVSECRDKCRDESREC